MRSIYYHNLGANRVAYDDAYECFQNREREFTAFGPGDIRELYMQVMFEHPEFFYVSKQFSVSNGSFEKIIQPKYIYSFYEMEQINRQLEEVSDRIISELINEHQSDYDKVLVLHDYLKSHLEYDDDEVNHMYSTEEESVEAHSIVGALLKNKCVCEGFAKAFKYLCDKVGLECWAVFGEANSELTRGNHAWNIVKINGYYHHVDVTWDNQFASDSAVPNYAYLNLSDEEISRNHTWKRENYPKCPMSPYNYFRMNGALLSSRAQLERFLHDNMMNEEERIVFRVERGSVLEREINGCLNDCVFGVAGRLKYVHVNEYLMENVPAQLVYSVLPSYRLY